MGARTATTAVVVLAALLTTPTAADAASVHLNAATRITAPGARAKVTVTVTGAGVCTLSAGGRRARATVPAGVTQLRFGFTVRRDARPGRYRVTVGCPAPNAGATVTVRRRRGGRVRQLIAPGSVRVAVRTVRASAHESDPHPAPPPVSIPVPDPAPLTDAQALADATAAWGVSGSAIEAGFRNGQCTDYVQRARPDVVRTYFIRMWASRMLNPAFTFAADFDAYLWDDDARAAGLTVSDVPRPGAVMVLERGVQGASAEYGHVAIVTTSADPADGRFRVHQMNVGGPYVEGDGRYRRGAGVSFVL